MRTKGRNASGCNCTIRALNSYMHWTTGSDRKCGAACRHPRIQQLKEPKTIFPTLTEAQIKRLVAWRPKPKVVYERRLHLLALILLDTGCRITEALTLRVHDLDLDNLLVTLDGKGRKQRVVPFSFALRKAAYRYVVDFDRRPERLLLATNAETALGRDNARRDVKLLCAQLGFTAPCRTLHAFRHTFAVNYLRRGGSVFHLQKVLGHSSLEMTRRYANLVTADLQAVHERVSLLSK
jgi:integrase/recombinase XerD